MNDGPKVNRSPTTLAAGGRMSLAINCLRHLF